MIPIRVHGQRSSIPTVTYAILSLNVVSWMLLQEYGSENGLTASICKYALWPGALWEYDAFDVPPECLYLHATPDSRSIVLFTSMFLHGGWVHLIGNMWYLLVLAPHIEDRSGSPIAFLLFYLACGLGAAAAQIAIAPHSMIPVLGASGAIAGLLGAYVVLFPRLKIDLLFSIHFPLPLRMPVVIVAAGWFALQVLGSVYDLLGREGDIAHGAHVGGLMTGVTLSLLYKLYERSPFNRPRHGGGPRLSTHHVGIDLGTSNGCVAVLGDGDPRIIEHSYRGQTAQTTPTFVSFVDGGTVVVGERAKRQTIDCPEHPHLYSVKRFLGRRLPDDMNGWRVPYKLVQEPESGDIMIEAPGKNFITTQQAIAHVLTALWTTASAHFGQHATCTKAVIAVPACSNHLQRKATIETARIAGLEVTAMISDPAAAALTYCTEQRLRKGTAAVVDIGGSTCDVAIVDISTENGEYTLRVLAHSGNSLLGGEDFDQLIVNYLADRFKKEYGIDLRDSNLALHRLKESSEKAKIDLSSKKTTSIRLTYITSDMSSGHKHLESSLTRSEFDSMASGLIERILGHCRRAIFASGRTLKDLDAVILTGGQTHMPLLRQQVRAYFDREVHRPSNFAGSVAAGAAIFATTLSGQSDIVRVIEATSHSVIMKDPGGDIIPLIEKNTPTPAVSNLNIATVRPDQTSISFRIIQEGDLEPEKDAHLLGWYELENIPPSSQGERQYRLRFSLDAYGLLDVSARDLSTGEEHPVTHRAPTSSAGPMSDCNASAGFVVVTTQSEV